MHALRWMKEHYEATGRERRDEIGCGTRWVAVIRGAAGFFCQPEWSHVLVKVGTDLGDNVAFPHIAFTSKECPKKLRTFFPFIETTYRLPGLGLFG